MSIKMFSLNMGNDNHFTKKIYLMLAKIKL